MAFRVTREWGDGRAGASVVLSSISEVFAWALDEGLLYDYTERRTFRNTDGRVHLEPHRFGSLPTITYTIEEVSCSTP